uniref:Ovule protein n=1 Tax=Caenorhabditis tropicalis TaxID=1561998 RepID=A0A1I7U4K8_9PELO
MSPTIQLPILQWNPSNRHFYPNYFPTFDVLHSSNSFSTSPPPYSFSKISRRSPSDLFRESGDRGVS